MVEGRKKRDEKTGELSGFHVTFDKPREAYDGRTFVIIDDLCSRGGTFVGIADALEDTLGRKPNIVLITAHMEYAFFDGFIPHDDRFIQVMTTDAMIDPTNLVGKWQSEKLTVVDSATLL